MFSVFTYLLHEYLGKIYNSNRKFLERHLGREFIDEQWVLREYEDMFLRGFVSNKIMDKKSSEIIGFIDFKIAEETYLSLLMLHHDQKNRGIGKEIIIGFKEYAKNLNSISIRIDVIGDYDESVLKFWINNGFKFQSQVKLSWNNKDLVAMKMVNDML